MRKAILIIGFGLLACFCVATPLKDPKRVINGLTVDLTPLFQWWPKQKEDRPLTAWVHLSGAVVLTNGYGWVLTAPIIDGHGHSGETNGLNRILLRNPPLQDRNRFDTLLARKKSLEQQRAGLSQQAEDADARLKDIAAERKASQQRHVASRASNAQDNTWKHNEKAAKAEIKPLDVQIKEIDQQLKDYLSQDHYLVDCFALRTAEQVNGLPIYDHGKPLR